MASPRSIVKGVKVNPTLPPRYTWKIKLLHNYSVAHNDKVYMLAIDDLGNGSYRLVGYWGKRTGSLQMTHIVTGSLTMCESQMDDTIKAKKAKGYEDVEHYGYEVPANVSTNLEEQMKKIDTTRLVGYAAPQSQPGTSTKYANQPASFASEAPKKKGATKTKKQPEPPAPTPSAPKRAKRQIHI